MTSPETKSDLGWRGRVPRRSVQHPLTSRRNVSYVRRPSWSFDGVVEALLYALLVFTPLAFGSVEAWSREVFLLVVAAAAVVTAAKHGSFAWRGRGPGYTWSWAYPVMLGFLALCVLQLIPLPASVIRAVSPETVRLKAELLADVPDVATVLRRTTLSFYPHVTVRQAVLASAVATLFAVVLDVFRDPTRIRRLLSVVAGMGLVVAGLAIYQNLTGATTIYGLVPAGHRNSGPFHNYSHFSQFINMSVGAALALLLDRATQLSGSYRSPGEVWVALREPRNFDVWAWVVLCVVGPVTVFLSMSRMGIISLMLGGALTAAALVWRGGPAGAGRSAKVMAAAGLAVFAVLLCVGYERVAARLSTLGDLEAAGDGRQQILRDLAVEFRQFPILGTGLGTNEFVYGLYDRRDASTVATHAENEYAQLMEETGAVGVTLAALFLACIGLNYARATRHPREPIGYVPFGLGLGLIAVFVHSGSDWGQHVPANAALTAIFAALLVVLARRQPQSSTDVVSDAPRGRMSWAPLVGHVAILVVVAGSTAAVAWWADRERSAESLWRTALARAASLESRGWQGTDADYIGLLQPAAAAVDRAPGNAVYRYLTDAYRWHAIARTVDPKTGRPTLSADDVQFARQLVDDLDADRILCPTYGSPLSLAGQINEHVLGRVELGRLQIRESCRLSPYDRPLCLIAGLDAVAARRWDEAADELGRYVRMGGTIRDFTDACLAVGMPKIPYQIAKHDREALLYLAGRMPVAPAWAPLAARCRSEAADLLAVEAARPDAPAALLAAQGDAEQRQQHAAAAVDLYRRALAKDYGNVAWRMQMARALAAEDRYADAVSELQTCLQLRPDLHDAQTLLTNYERRAGGGTSTRSDAATGH